MWSARLYHIFFSHCLTNSKLKKKELLNIECVFRLYLQIYLRRIEQDIILNIYLSKYTLFMLEFNETGIFRKDFWKTLKNQISWKPVQWESSCSMRTDGHTVKQAKNWRTDMTKLISIFSQFCERSQKWAWIFTVIIVHR